MRKPWVAVLVVVCTAVLAPIASAGTLPGGYTLSVLAGRPPVVSGTVATNDFLRITGSAEDASGNVYLADYQGYVEKVTPAGTLSIFAGNGHAFIAPKAGPAKSSPMTPNGIAVDSHGNVYLSDDAGYVEKATPGGSLTIIAGNGSVGAPRLGSATSSPLLPEALAVDSAGNVYIVDRTSPAEGFARYVLKVTPGGTLSIVAGNGALGKPTAGAAKSSPLSASAVAVDLGRNVYIADSTGYVVKVNRAGLLLPIAGDGTGDGPTPGPAQSSALTPLGVAVDRSGNVFIADYPTSSSGYIDKVSTTGTLSIVAGNGRQGGVKPGPATSSPINPITVSVDSSGNLYLGDLQSGLGLKVTTTGTLSVFAGSQQPTLGPVKSTLLSIDDMVRDSGGNIYIADGRGYVDKVSPTGDLTVFAGSGDTYRAPIPGPATSSPMRPVRLALDSTGDLYIADWGGWVEKVTPGGLLSVVAGSGQQGGAVSGPALSSPLIPDDIAVDRSGNLYITDFVGHVSKVTPDGTLSNFAGNGTQQGKPTTGPATSSHVFADAVTTDTAGNVYLAELNGYVYKVTPSGMLSIVAGNGDSGRPAIAGMAVSSPIAPWQIAIDGSGNLFISDFNGYLEKVTAAGVLSIIGGHGSNVGPPGSSPGASTPAASGPWTPGSIAFGPSHTLLISDLGRYLDRLMPSALRTLSSQARSVTFGTSARVGMTLTARVTGSWVAGSTTLSPRYQWYTIRGGIWIAITGATRRTFTPGRALYGRTIGVKAVAASPPGYVTATPVTSRIVKVS